MTLGKKLVVCREKKGLQQLEAAKFLGISNVVLNRYEKDERKPDPDTIKKLAEFYNVTTDYLLSHDNNSKSDKTKRIWDVIARAEDFPEENIDQVIDTLEAILKHHEDKLKNKK